MWAVLFVCSLQFTTSRTSITQQSFLCTAHQDPGEIHTSVHLKVGALDLVEAVKLEDHQWWHLWPQLPSVVAVPATLVLQAVAVMPVTPEMLAGMAAPMTPAIPAPVTAPVTMAIQATMMQWPLWQNRVVGGKYTSPNIATRKQKQKKPKLCATSPSAGK